MTVSPTGEATQPRAGIDDDLDLDRVAGGPGQVASSRAFWSSVG